MSLKSNGNGSCFCPGETLLHLPWRIRLRFHNHAPQHLACGLPFHKQAADEVWGDHLGGAGEEGVGQGWEVLDGRGGYGDDWVRKCYWILTGLMGWANGGELFRFHEMSAEQLTALLSKLNDDAGLQEKLKGAADLDAAVAMAQEAGFDVSKADWLRYQAKQTLELSDEELEGDLVGGTAGTCFHSQWRTDHSLGEIPMCR